MITNKIISIPLAISALLMSTAACSDSSNSTVTTSAAVQNSASSDKNTADKPSFDTKTIATFNEPWAMTALPDKEASIKLLITQKSGELFIVDTTSGTKTPVTGVPKVAYGGQGGLGDVIVAPDFARSNEIYISYAEASKDGRKFGAKVVKAKLAGLGTDKPTLTNITPIWEQSPKVTGQGHYSHRLLFSPDGRYLYISSGERQKKTPAQNMSGNLGKIIRLHPDGTIPKDNPFADQGEVAKQFWTLGNRNVLGMQFDNNGKLWAHEMGPRGGDELNVIKKGHNYGWPIVSNGRNYNGTPIPDHDTRPDFTPPITSWTPVISPSSMSIYNQGEHNDFPAWQGDALISGLSSKALIVVDLMDDTASERYRYDMGARIRSVLAVDGEVWALEDGSDAQLLQLIPK